MANQPFDREVINLRERPLSSDIDFGSSYGDQALREVLRNLFMANVNTFSGVQSPSEGFIGSGFRVNQTAVPSMAVRIAAGLGWIDNAADVPANIGGVVGVNDLCPLKPLSLTADEIIAVPPSDPVNDRIDIVQVRVDRRLQDPSTRDILNPGTGIFAPGVVNKTLSFNLNGRSSVNGATGIVYKTGTPAAVPVAPAVDAGYKKIAEVIVTATSVVVAQNRIRDLRFLMYAGGSGRGNVVLSTTGGISTVIRHALPPGWMLSPTNTGPGTSAQLLVSVGGLIDSSMISCLAFLESNSAAQVGGLQTSMFVNPDPFLVTGAYQGFVAGASGLQIAQGQPSFLIGLSPAESGGAIPDPCRVNVEITVQNQI